MIATNLKDEIAADTFAINTMRNEPIYANFVQYLSISLHWLWQETAKSSAIGWVSFLNPTYIFS
jgi:hypothetical protein